MCTEYIKVSCNDLHLWEKLYKISIKKCDVFILYDNEYTSIIDIYVYEYFHWLKSWALVLQNILDTLSDVLDKCLRFSLINIESVSVTQAKPRLMPSSQSVVYTFLLKFYL